MRIVDKLTLRVPETILDACEQCQYMQAEHQHVC